MDLRSNKPSSFYGSTVRSYNRPDKAKDVVDQSNSNNVEKKEPVGVFIAGPFMSKILTQAHEIKGYTFRAIFGRIDTIETKTKLIDGDSNPDQTKKEHVEFSAHFMVPIPLKVWSKPKHLWTHVSFREWQNDVIKALNLGEDFKFIGFIRFREMDREKAKKTPFVANEVKLCAKITEFEKIPLILMAVNSHIVHSLQEMRREQIPGERLPYVTSTNITTAYIPSSDFSKTAYAEVKNINLGEPLPARICFNLDLRKTFNPLLNMVAQFKAELKQTCQTYSKPSLNETDNESDDYIKGLDTSSSDEVDIEEDSVTNALVKDEIDVEKDSVDITMENEQDETSTLPVTSAEDDSGQKENKTPNQNFPKDTPDKKIIIDGSIYSNTEYLSSTEVQSSSSQTPSTSTSSLQTETSSPIPATPEFKVKKKLSLARPFQKKHANIEPTSKQSPLRSSTALKADFDEITREIPAQQQPPIRKFFKSKNKLEDSLVRSEHNALDPNSSPTGTPPKKLKQEQ